MPTNDELRGRALRVIPGGITSAIRALGSVERDSYFAAKAEGPHVWDVEGNRYLDLVMSHGAIILGHAYPTVIDAVMSAAADGTSFGAPTEAEVLLAEAVCERVPSVESIRFVSSATEATMGAIGVARGFTRRSRIVTFEGNANGGFDGGFDGGSTAGVTVTTPGGIQGNQVVVAPYNVVPTLDEDVACVIVEPIATNMGLVAPLPGFLEGLRTECDRVGALLVFDEVVTGFRVGVGGAQELCCVRPDLTTFGNVIGGGLPIGAFGGRADVMRVLAPLGPVYQPDNPSGNPLAAAAGLAALEMSTDSVYRTIEARAERLAKRLAEAFDEAGIDARVPRVATLVGLYLGAELPVDLTGARRTDERHYARFFHAMLDRGVMIAPSAYGVAFPSLAHSDDVIDQIVAVAHEAAATLS